MKKAKFRGAIFEVCHKRVGLGPKAENRSFGNGHETKKTPTGQLERAKARTTRSSWFQTSDLWRRLFV